MIRFHVEEEDARVSKGDESLDCDHPIEKGDTFYVVYDHDEPVMEVCENCVIVDKEE
jgi:hypothetical protein